jgi:uncharacterized integral membrane protein
MGEDELMQAEKSGDEEAEAKRREAESDEDWQPQLWSKIILLLVVVGYGIALVVANTFKVKISFLFASINVSEVWLILLCFVIGLLSGVLVSQVHRHRKAERARLEEQAEQAKES